MEKQELITLVKEAQDSMKTLMKYAGTMNSSVNLLLLNWPDALMYHAEGNESKLRESLGLMICQPLKVLAEALTQHTEQKVKSKIALEDINMSMIIANKNPLEAKENLIRICNSRIFMLKSVGEKLEMIGEKND